jgi:hypothetical protein
LDNNPIYGDRHLGRKRHQEYSKRYPSTNLHHPVPKSRIPRGSCEIERIALRRANAWIVFPYAKKAHGAYHSLFWNLRIDQVWNNLAKIHRSIFESEEEFIRPWWIEDCDLESAMERKRHDFNQKKMLYVAKEVRVVALKSAWLRSFGGYDLITAENFLYLNMLFMIFGTELINWKKLLDNDHLIEFLENDKLDGSRLWASETLFGDGGSVRSIKSRIARILNKYPLYS